jgi:hypothetical protein
LKNLFDEIAQLKK